MFFTIVSDPDDEFGSENERYIVKLDKTEGNDCFFLRGNTGVGFVCHEALEDFNT